MDQYEFLLEIGANFMELLQDATAWFVQFMEDLAAYIESKGGL